MLSSATLNHTIDEKAAPELKIRTANKDDIPAINAIIIDAIGTWKIAERVRQLSRHAYQYDESDLEDGEIRLLIDSSDQPVGLTHWAPASVTDTPADATNAAILHGLYLRATSHRQGLGRQLLTDCMERAAIGGHDALTLRAQRDAEPFFRAQGFEPVSQESSTPLYPRRMLKRLIPA